MIVRQGQEQNLNRWITLRTDSNKIRTRMSAELWSVSLNLSLLIEASKIDGVINNEELELIKSILVNKFHLDSSKAEKSINFVINKSEEKVEIYSDIRVILNNMDHHERISVIEMLWKIILADGEIDQYESNLISRICGLLHITGPESYAAKKRALK